jgi:hypothetical protein
MVSAKVQLRKGRLGYPRDLLPNEVEKENDPPAYEN